MKKSRLRGLNYIPKVTQVVRAGSRRVEARSLTSSIEITAKCHEGSLLPHCPCDNLFVTGISCKLINQLFRLWMRGLLMVLIGFLFP